MGFIASLQKEILEQWRTSRLLVLVIVLGVFGMISPLLANFMPEIFKMVPGAEQFAGMIPAPTLKDAIDQYLKNIGQFAILLAIFLSMGTVVQEKERGTAVMVLSKPLSRWAFILTKFLAIGFSFLTSLAVAGLLGYGYTVFLFQAPDGAAWIEMNLLIWVYCLVFVAITLLGSLFARSQAVAAGVGFGGLLLMALIGSLPGLGQYLPSQLLTWASALFYQPGVEYWTALWISLGLIVVCLFTAWLIFRKQEL